MKKKGNIAAVAVGILLAVAGLYLLKNILQPEGIMVSLPYICIGLGCGLFGHGFGNIISARVLKKSPETARRMEIEAKDERNIAVGNKAKARAYDIMVMVFGALMVSFALMGVQLAAVLLLVAAYLFVVGCSIYYRCKFDREM